MRLSGPPSYSSVRSSRLWGLRRGPSSYVSQRRTSEEFLFVGSCSRCSHLEIWCIISLWPRIRQSGFLCLGDTCGVQIIGFFGRFCGYSGAMLGSTVDTCFASVLCLWMNYAHFLLRILRCSVSVLTQNGEVCSADASAFSMRWKLILRGSRGWQHL